MSTNNKNTNKNNNTKNNNSYLENIVNTNIKNITKNKIKPKKIYKKNDNSAKRKLSIMQQKFVDNYIICGNITQAALKAGYAKKSASSSGTELLKLPKIKAAVEEQLKKIEDKKIAKADEVLKFITSVVRGEVKDPVVVTESKGDGYSQARIVNKPAGLKERLSAAEKLMKRYGLLTDKVEIKDDRTKEVKDDAIDSLLQTLKMRDIDFEDGGDE